MRAKARVGEAKLVGFFAHHLVSCFYESPLMFCRRLSAGFFDALLYDQAMNFSHVPCHGLSDWRAQFGVWSRKQFEGFLSLLFVCATRLHGITASRATRLQ